jgi:hypothetical protein
MSDNQKSKRGEGKRKETSILPLTDAEIDVAKETSQINEIEITKKISADDNREKKKKKKRDTSPSEVSKATKTSKRRYRR